MDFRLNPEQQLLRDGLARFLAERYHLAASRSAARTGAGWQPPIWHALADELGVLGATLPEWAGGTGGGPVELMVISEELGRALVIEPFVETVAVAGGLLARAGGPEATAVLERICAGSAVVAVAVDDDGEPAHAVRDGQRWALHGTKAVVTAAPLATHLLITARASDGLGLFLTGFDAAAPPPGARVHAYRTIDDRRAADLVLDGLSLPPAALIDADAEASVRQALDEGAAAVCAEAVGAMRRVLTDTVDYCRQRQQFGQPISNFQVLAHRMVDMYCELEQAVAAVFLAMLHLAADPPTRARAVSAAKVTVGRAARFVGQNAVQLHGGMGMTEELAVGHYFKRLTAVQYEFGSSDFHRARYDRLTRGNSGEGL